MSFIRLLVAGRRDGGVIDLDNVKWEEFGFHGPDDFLAAVERGVERGHLERDGDHLLRLTIRGDATAALSPVTADGLPPVGVRAKVPPPLPPPLPPMPTPPPLPPMPSPPPPLPPPPAAPVDVFVEEDTQPSKTKPVKPPKPHKPSRK